MNNHKPT